MLDPNVRPPVFGDQSNYRKSFERLAGFATVVKLSDGDARWNYRELDSAAAMEHVLALGPKLVVVTLGSRGAIAATPDTRDRSLLFRSTSWTRLRRRRVWRGAAGSAG